MIVKNYVPNDVQGVYYIPSDDVTVPAATGIQRLVVSDIIKKCN